MYLFVWWYKKTKWCESHNHKHKINNKKRKKFEEKEETKQIYYGNNKPKSERRRFEIMPFCMFFGCTRLSWSVLCVNCIVLYVNMFTYVFSWTRAIIFISFVSCVSNIVVLCVFFCVCTLCLCKRSSSFSE